MRGSCPVQAPRAHYRVDEETPLAWGGRVAPAHPRERGRYCFHSSNAKMLCGLSPRAGEILLPLQQSEDALRFIPASGGDTAPPRHYPATPGGCQRSLTHVSGANSLSGVVARELSGLMGTEEASHDPDTVVTRVSRTTGRSTTRGRRGIDQARRGRFAEHHASAAPVSAVGALRVAERHRQGVRQGQVPAACVVGFVVDNRLDRLHAVA